MGKPRIPNKHRRTIEAMKGEVMSGVSALHMEPQLIDPEKGYDTPDMFMSDLDVYVKHAIEHFYAAIHDCTPDRRQIHRTARRYFRVLHNKLNDPALSPGSKRLWENMIIDKLCSKILGF